RQRSRQSLGANPDSSARWQHWVSCSSSKMCTHHRTACSVRRPPALQNASPRKGRFHSRVVLARYEARADMNAGPWIDRPIKLARRASTNDKIFFFSADWLGIAEAISETGNSMGLVGTALTYFSVSY